MLTNMVGLEMQYTKLSGTLPYEFVLMQARRDLAEISPRYRREISPRDIAEIAPTSRRDLAEMYACASPPHELPIACAYSHMISGRAVEHSSDCSAYLCSLSKFILCLDAGSG